MGVVRQKRPTAAEVLSTVAAATDHTHRHCTHDTTARVSGKATAGCQRGPTGNRPATDGILTVQTARMWARTLLTGRRRCGASASTLRQGATREDPPRCYRRALAGAEPRRRRPRTAELQRALGQPPPSFCPQP